MQVIQTISQKSFLSEKKNGPKLGCGHWAICNQQAALDFLLIAAMLFFSEVGHNQCKYVTVHVV